MKLALIKLAAAAMREQRDLSIKYGINLAPDTPYCIRCCLFMYVVIICMCPYGATYP
jgi:hypothetical protein